MSVRSRLKKMEHREAALQGKVMRLEHEVREMQDLLGDKAPFTHEISFPSSYSYMYQASMPIPLTSIIRAICDHLNISVEHVPSRAAHAIVKKKEKL